jgi:hypothetical protein
MPLLRLLFAYCSPQCEGNAQEIRNKCEVEHLEIKGKKLLLDYLVVMPWQFSTWKAGRRV